MIQTILIPLTYNGKKISLKKAINWIKKKGYKEYFITKTADGKKIKKGAHIRGGYYRFRQSEPLTAYEKKNGWYYATDKLRNGILLVWKYYI